MNDVDKFMRDLRLDPAEISDDDYIVLEKALAEYDADTGEEDGDEEYVSLADAIEDLADGEVELVDAGELVADISKALSKAAEDRLAPIRDEVREIRKTTARLRKSVEALEQNPRAASEAQPVAKCPRVKPIVDRRSGKPPDPVG